jgi:hypothetical protein
MLIQLSHALAEVVSMWQTLCQPNICAELATCRIQEKILSAKVDNQGFQKIRAVFIMSAFESMKCSRSKNFS